MTGGSNRRNLHRVYGYFPILKERRVRGFRLCRAANSRSGHRARLDGFPDLLLLDEPSLGLAPLIVKAIFEIIATIAKEGTTILIVEQNAIKR
jgi:branched-chain amino acid transport system ATP-binding protein